MALGQRREGLGAMQAAFGIGSNFITPEGLTENLAVLRDTCPVMVFEGTKLDILTWKPVLHVCKNKAKQKHPSGKIQPLNPC